MNQKLTTTPSNQEIIRAMKSMSNLKSPDLDGFSVLSCNNYWSIVGEVVVEEIQSFFNSGKLKSALNHTFISLISKSNAA